MQGRDEAPKRPQKNGAGGFLLLVAMAQAFKSFLLLVALVAVPGTRTRDSSGVSLDMEFTRPHWGARDKFPTCETDHMDLAIGLDQGGIRKE